MSYEISELREMLFDHKNNEFLEMAMVILQDMGNKIIYLKDEEINTYNRCIQDIGYFLNNKDYLTVSDIIKYELVPLFLTKEH